MVRPKMLPIGQSGLVILLVRFNSYYGGHKQRQIIEQKWILTRWLRAFWRMPHNGMRL